MSFGAPVTGLLSLAAPTPRAPSLPSLEGAFLKNRIGLLMSLRRKRLKTNSFAIFRWRISEKSEAEVVKQSNAGLQKAVPQDSILTWLISIQREISTNDFSFAA